MQDKLPAMLGMARRAGALHGGYDQCVRIIREKKAVLAVAAADISDKTMKNLTFEGNREKISVIRLPYSIAEVSKACGFRAGVAVVTDKGFAKAIQGLAEEKQQEAASDQNGESGGLDSIGKIPEIQ